MVCVYFVRFLDWQTFDVGDNPRRPPRFSEEHDGSLGINLFISLNSEKRLLLLQYAINSPDSCSLAKHLCSSSLCSFLSCRCPICVYCFFPKHTQSNTSATHVVLYHIFINMSCWCCVGHHLAK